GHAVARPHPRARPSRGRADERRNEPGPRAPPGGAGPRPAGARPRPLHGPAPRSPRPPPAAGTLCPLRPRPRPQRRRATSRASPARLMPIEDRPMSLSDLSIKNPVFAVMLSAAMIVFGYLGYRDMGVSQFPEIDFPVVSIVITREAASPDIMDGDV